MAEKEHLRIRIEAKLLKKIDAARKDSGRTRTEEIETRLLASFMRTDIELVAEMAVHNVLVKVHELEARAARAEGREPRDFYGALYDQERNKVSRQEEEKSK
jgi:hypothetical protein